MSPLQLHKSDLTDMLAANTGNRSFAQALQHSANAEDVVRILGQYIYFNSVFGGGVANLAGEIAVRQSLFRDPGEPVAMLADRSAEVGAGIFFAAVDEFGDRSTVNQDVHRSLSQATLKATADFFGIGGEALNNILCQKGATSAAMAQVKQGYGLNRSLEDHEIFQAMGFHAGSEILADEEFRILDTFLRERYPQLVEYLKTAEVEIGGSKRPAYVWIHIHTSVEADHFAFALQGANSALRYYAGPEDSARVRAWILEGFEQFSRLQAGFMRQLQDA